MPNVNSPFGFLPIARGHGAGAIVIQPKKKASATPAIYKGDVLAPTTTPGVIAATAAANYVGVAVHGVPTGIVPNPDLLVYTDERQRFIAQFDNVGGGLAAADENLNALILFGTPAVTDWTARNFVDRSAQSVSGASKATTNTHDVKLDGLNLRTGNEYGDFAVVELFFNRHFNMLQGAGI
jgi:hypothetical protein